MAEPDSILGKIQKCPTDDLDGVNVEAICQLLRERELGYTRRIVEDIGKDPVKLLDKMLKRGEIKETDYPLLLGILKGTVLTDCVQKFKDIIGEYKGCRRLYLIDGEQDDYYPFKENRKGLVAIINNFTKREDGERFREGTKQDEEEIVKFFKSGRFASLYDVEEPGVDLDYDECEKFLANLATKLKSGKVSYHSFFLFVLSHGGENGVEMYCSSGEEPKVMAIEKITARYKECLPDCPKVFVIQACRGRFDNRPQFVAKDVVGSGSGSHQPADDSESNTETASVDDPVTYIENGPPEAADMLIVFAAVKGYVAYRLTSGGLLGSWFIQTLFKELKEAHKEEYYSSHLLDLLTNVQNKVSQMLEPMKRATHGREKVRQMPCFQSSLTKKFYLLSNPVLPK